MQTVGDWFPDPVWRGLALVSRCVQSAQAKLAGFMPVFFVLSYNELMADNKQTVHGPVVPETEAAQELKATRQSDAEIIAVTRHQGINMIWERTQQGIAILCVAASVGSSLYLIFLGEDPLAERGYQFLTNVGLLVIGFYFGRTNHTRPTGEKQ